MKKKSGFTLVELLIVSMLTVLIMMGAAQLFRISIQSQQQTSAEMNSQIARTRVQTAFQVVNQELSSASSDSSLGAAVPTVVGAPDSGTINYSQLNAEGDGIVKRSFQYQRSINGTYQLTYTNENKQVQTLLNGEVDQLSWTKVDSTASKRPGVAITYHIANDFGNTHPTTYQIVYLNFF